MQKQTDLEGKIVDSIDPIKLLRRGKQKSIEHLQIISENDEWSTPRVMLLMKCRHFLFEPTFDYASSFINHKFENYFTEEDDALVRAWLYDGYLNPPYSKVKQFMTKIIAEWKKNGKAYLILVFSKTDVSWYQDLIEPLRKDGKIIVEFQRGRIDFDEVDEIANVVWSANHKVWAVKYFIDKDGFTKWKVTKSSPYPNMWIFLPPAQERLT